ncbi:MAG: hypothetical protein ABWU84_07480 [Pyrobaculum sp.]|uniref:hypothetical protein n=1 Tax=Pyrobaculum sp. TaxID=2004705 RepID=UPI003EEC0D9F
MAEVVAYRRVWGVCCSGRCCAPRRCDGSALAEFRGIHVPPLNVYVGGQWVGRVVGYVADAPYPPLRGKGWSRLTTRRQVIGGRRYLLYPEVSEVAEVAWLPPPNLLAVFYKVDPSLLFQWWEWYKIPLKSAERYPGSGKLTGEEFRIVEPENDYLRLVGRGGDEYLAWDFVLGTLDTGEWILLGEDGLYLAKREGDRVVVERPYDGLIYDVRGPPYAPFYPVVPVKWVRKRLGEVRRRAGRYAAEIFKAPIDAVYLLRWPLVLFKWEYEVVLDREAHPVYVYVVHPG